MIATDTAQVCDTAVYAPLLDQFTQGETIYIPGATGEIAGLVDALRTAPDRARGVRLMGCFVPGMNEFDYAGLDPSTRVATFMLPRAMRQSFLDGRIDLIPRSYTGAAMLLSQTAFDLAIAHVAPPDANGQCSLGIASDFAPLVWTRARRRALVINPSMPAMHRGPRLPIADADIVVEAESPLVTFASPSPGEEADAIARRVAELIPDHAHIQTGIGGAPGALWGHLTTHKGLVLRSGMANVGLRALAEAGALAGGGHLVGIAYGTLGFYRYLAETDLVAFASTPETHGYTYLAPLPRLHTVNGALEVDLFGQVNAEWQGGRLFSGVGGAADYTRAAMASPGGRSIIALPATAKGGTISRIVTTITAPAIGLPRTDIDTVVTEHGAVELRNLSLDARAEALISIAAPTFREALSRNWSELRKTF